MVYNNKVYRLRLLIKLLVNLSVNGDIKTLKILE